MVYRGCLIGAVVVQLAFATSAVAGQGFTCADFRELSAAEQQRYLQGYTLGVAMEMKYFKNNVLNLPVSNALKQPPDHPGSQLEFFREVVRKGMDYVDDRYALANIAVAYPAQFLTATQKECEAKAMQDIGMFDVLPVVLANMRRSGMFPVWGM